MNPTQSLVPSNGVHISQSHYPAGYYVARYDAQGFTSSPRWFPALAEAQEYARVIAQERRLPERTR